ncbi:MAG TPA: hypothetical protein VFH99_02050 [Candidatus Saccharimonadales bacterium]|nr:hypothetical protein [Candidatus Saccharimonadales bacterium]
MSESLGYFIGRNEIKVPRIDESYIKIPDVLRFFQELEALNSLPQTHRYGYSTSKELCLPESSEKPLVILSSHYDILYGPDGNSVDKEVVRRQICVPPDQPGPLNSFLNYEKERRKSALRKSSLDPYEQSEEFTFQDQTFREPQIKSSRADQAAHIGICVQTALDATVELLSC